MCSHRKGSHPASENTEGVASDIMLSAVVHTQKKEGGRRRRKERRRKGQLTNVGRAGEEKVIIL